MNTLLINPFKKIAGAKALGLGLIAMMLTTYSGSLNGVHFDGLLDIHFGFKTILIIFIGEAFIGWLCISIIFSISALLFSKSSVRIIDIFGTQALARAPMLLASLAAFIPFFRNTDPSSINMIALSLLLVVIIIWYIILMYNAYKVSANLKGNVLTISFIAGIIIAEVLSKFSLFLYFKFLTL